MNCRIFLFAIVILTLCFSAAVEAQEGEAAEWARDIRGRRSATFEDAVKQMVRENPGLSEAEARSLLEKVQRAMNSWQGDGTGSTTHRLAGRRAGWDDSQLSAVHLRGLNAPEIGTQATQANEYWLRYLQSWAFSEEGWEKFLDANPLAKEPSEKHSKHNDHHHHTTNNQAQLYDSCKDSQDQATCEQNRKEVAARIRKLIAESAGHNGSRRAKSPTSTRPQSNK